MMTPKRTTLMLTLLALTLSAVAAFAKTEHKFEKQRKFKKVTDIQSFELSAPKDALTARLKVEFKLKSGKVEWILTDPEGEERMTGNASSGRALGNTGKLKAIPGVWMLEIRIEQATGSYEIGWVAR